MRPQSAGIILYRFQKMFLEILLVHPGEPYWIKSDEGAWSIPKGEFGEDENPVNAAKREMEEETGIEIKEVQFELIPVKIKSIKTIYAWAAKSDFDATQIRD